MLVLSLPTKMSSAPIIYLVLCLVSLFIRANGKDIRTRPAVTQQDIRKSTGNLASQFILQPDSKNMQNLRTSKYQPNTGLLGLKRVDKDMPMTKKAFSWFRQDAGARLAVPNTSDQLQKSNSICNTWSLSTLCGLLTG